MTQQHSSPMIFTSYGREWIIHRPADLEGLWDALDDDSFTQDERIPYWVELWPASFALAEWITEHSLAIKDKVCLDLGCGLGFTAMIGMLAGARVIGMDYEPQALAYARLNAEENKISQPVWAVMDWRFPALCKGCCKYVWGGDVMYEKRFVQPVLNFLEYALAPGGCMWLAEPGRSVYREFNETLKERGWKTERVRRQRVTALDGISLMANIWQISRLGE